MIMRIGPVSPRRTEDAHHLESIKWFCQYVIRSQVQGFCPEVFICQPGTDDQDRTIRIGGSGRSRTLFNKSRQERDERSRSVTTSGILT